jgi:hypothetical protein
MKEPVFVDGKYHKSLGFVASSSFGQATGVYKDACPKS